MRTIAKLFGRSPFVPLQSHMNKVCACVDKIVEVFEALARGDYEQIDALAKVISQLEHEADEVKYDIQNHLPKRMFLPVDRGKLLDILGTQDSIADKCENIAVLLTLKRISMPDVLRETFKSYLQKNVEAYYTARDIIEQFDELVETRFGGVEAERVKKMVDDVAYKEHEVDLMQRDLLKILFSLDDRMSVSEFHVWNHIVRQVSELSNVSERLANRVRTTLVLK